MIPDRQATTFDPGIPSGGRAPVLRLPLAPLACALALAASACGDTLVDHDGDRFYAGQTCQGTPTSCGSGSACVDCTASPPPANARKICSAAAACDFECKGGWLRCGAACCRALSVAAGWYHTCAILGQPADTSGWLKCWGANDQGQLGKGDLLDSPAPVNVAGLAQGVTQVAAGAFHTCAVQNGTPYCWGMNDFGQVGAGTTLPRYAYPQAVVNSGTGQVSALAPGGRHTCARSSLDEVWCWGANDRGQLGQGDVDASPHNFPLKVASLAGVTALASGRYHACAVTGGAVRCWGANDLGQIGDGLGAVGVSQPTPVAAGSFTSAVSLAAGNEFSVAIASGTPDPELWGWGANAFGQLGLDPPPDVQLAPTLATISVKPTAVAAGRAHTCALKADAGGSLKCFGANDRYQLGDPLGNKVDVNFGVASPPIQVSAGQDHTCAVLAGGSLYCWGANDRGQVGNGVPLNPVGSPTLVTGR